MPVLLLCTLLSDGFVLLYDVDRLNETPDKDADKANYESSDKEADKANYESSDEAPDPFDEPYDATENIDVSERSNNTDSTTASKNRHVPKRTGPTKSTNALPKHTDTSKNKHVPKRSSSMITTRNTVATRNKDVPKSTSTITTRNSVATTNKDISKNNDISKRESTSPKNIRTAKNTGNIIYTVFYDNFVRCRRIFIILSLADSSVNLQLDGWQLSSWIGT